MSDNISADEVKRRLVIFLRIPTEVWTDILKLLPRRILVRKVSPVCFRFKEISDKNVKNIHVIEYAYNFHYKLGRDDPEANKQLEHLAGNDCQLAGQFRLTILFNPYIGEKSQAILRHCPDLFNGCRISLEFFEDSYNPPPTTLFFLECLGHLEKAKPVLINVDQHVDQVIDFWHHPTFLNCTRARVDLHHWPGLSSATLTSAFVNVFDWLHHQPNGMDCDGAADQQVVRCMIVELNGRQSEHIDWLLDCCSQDIQQSQGPTDRHPFVCSFTSSDWDSDWPDFGQQFRRVENKSTGEVLVLDRVLNAKRHSPSYRLRRCLAEEEADGAQFYAGMSHYDFGYEAFNIEEDKTPEVIIHRMIFWGEAYGCEAFNIDNEKTLEVMIR